MQNSAPQEGHTDKVSQPKAVVLTLVFFEAVGSGIDNGTKIGVSAGKVLSKFAAFATIPTLTALAGVKLSHHFADATQNYMPWIAGFAGYIAGNVVNNIPLWHSEQSSTRTAYGFNGTILPSELMENALVPLSQVPAIEKHTTVDRRTIYFVIEEAVDRAMRPFITMPCAAAGGILGGVIAGASTLGGMTYGALRSFFQKKAAPAMNASPSADEGQDTVPLTAEEMRVGPYRVRELSEEAARSFFDDMPDAGPNRTLH